MKFWRSLEGHLLAIYHDNTGQWEYQFFSKDCVPEQSISNSLNISIWFKFHFDEYYLRSFATPSRISQGFLNPKKMGSYVYCASPTQTDIQTHKQRTSFPGSSWSCLTYIKYESNKHFDKSFI